MRGSFLIARIAGTGVYIHFTFPLLVAFYGWLYYQRGGVDAAIYGVVFTLLLFFCVLLHEFGHAFAARIFGIRTPDITLLPIGGVARLESMPKSPWQELVIAVAGPAVNVVIAAGLGLFLFGGLLPHNILKIDEVSSSLGMDLLNINIALVLFNLIPAFPMDGGRVLRSVLAMFMKHAKATMIAARIGQGIAVLFVVASFTPYGNTMLLFIAMFVFMAAQQELAHVQVLASAHGTRVGDVMITRFEVVRENIRAGEMRALLFQSKQDVFPVVDANQQMKGLLTRENMLKEAKDLPAESPVSCSVYAIPSAAQDMEVDAAAELLRHAAIPLLAVVNSSRQLVGLISLNQLISLRKIRKEESL